MMDTLEEMKRSILTKLESYRRNQNDFIRDKEEDKSTQLIVQLKRMDGSAYKTTDLQSNPSEVVIGTCPEPQCEVSDVNVVQLDSNEPLLDENDETGDKLLSTSFESEIDVELDDKDVDGQPYDVNRLVHEAENLRCTYYQIDTGGNLANPSDIYFDPGTNVFGNEPESMENQTEVILHIPSPEENQLDNNSWNNERFEFQGNNNNMTLARKNFLNLEHIFLKKVQEDMERKNYAQKLMSKARYYDIIRIIKETKTKPLLSVRDRRFRKNYDILTIGETDKLIFPIKDLDAPIIYYVHIEEMFHILIDVHFGSRHVGKRSMWVELKKKYMNFTKDVIAIFVDLCVCNPRPVRINASTVHIQELMQTPIVEDIPEIVAVENFNTMESRFTEKMNQIADCMVDSIFFITKSDYHKFLQYVKNIDGNVSRQKGIIVRRLLRRLAVETICGKETLIAAKQFNPIEGGYLKYLHIEELFAVIHKVHITMKHAAKDVMFLLLRKEYMNIAMVAVEEYIELCQVCRRTKMSSREARRSNYLESDELVLDLYILDKTPHSSLSIPEMNLLFNLRLRELIDFSDCNVLTKQSYFLLIDEVKTAQSKMSKDLRDHHLSCLYDVIKHQDTEILTNSFQQPEETPFIIKQYIYFEQAFFIIHNCHISSGHGGSDIMIAKLTEKYQNINTDMVTLYLEICGFCLNKYAAYNRILIRRPPKTVEENQTEECLPTNPHEQNQHRTSLLDTDENGLQEAEDAEDEEVILIETSSDSSSDVEEVEGADRNTSKKLDETEDRTSDYRSSVQSQEGLGSDITEKQTKEYDQAEVIEREEPNLVDVDVKFEIEIEENAVNNDRPENQLRLHSKLSNIKDHRSSSLLLSIDIDTGPEVETANESSLVTQEIDHQVNKKNNDGLMETGSVNESITPTEDTGDVIKQASSAIIASAINHETAKIGETCTDCNLEEIEDRQEPLEKGLEGSMKQMSETNGSNQVDIFQSKDTGTAQEKHSDMHDSEPSEKHTSHLDEVFTSASVVADSEEEPTDQSIGAASIIPEKEHIQHDVEDIGCGTVTSESTCKKCKRCQTFTTDASTQTRKIGTVESESSKKNKSCNSLQKLNDVSALERKTRFIERLRGTKRVNGSIISQKAYLYLIEQVKKSKTDDLSKLAIDKNRINNYDVVTSDNTERLVTPMKTGNSMKIYVHIEEVFDIIDSAHTDTNHGGMLRMLKILRRKYQNVTKDMIRMYLETCSVCQKKFDMTSRCQVDMIDMQNNQVDGYSYVLVYHHHTKLVQLRPLKSKQVIDVAEAILDIFAILGAPSILHTSRSRNFTSCLVREICKQWSQIKVIPGKPKSKQANTVKIENMLACWMKAHDRKWTHGLRYLQVEINTDKTCLNAHQATFGTTFGFGLRSPLDHVTTEKELETVLYDGDCDIEVVGSEDSSEEFSDETDEPSSDTSTTEDEFVTVSSSYSVVRTKGDDNNTRKKPRLT
ncbi:unnamed protein product [Callosobruchus maculatus]|uniref:Integrase catalytic domain-containing protein n=1 Tax=Callosobruchus maculatus TaxID=64391 RepID=A0A653BRD2_CALMS|nr:unnamed protein product [Callosobruchus maculatus]